MKNIFLIFISGFIIFSCYYDNREELYPSVPIECDTSNFSYNSGVLAIMQNNCWGCHSSSSATDNGAGIVLDNYDDLKTMAESGRLMGALNGEPDYTPMPYNAAALNDCAIQTIQNWIDNAYPME